MNYSKLIHDYLDEGLDGSLEDMLFEKLASNAELRQDFNQQMKIHLLSNADMASIAPPAAITSAVFANLGFTAPANVSYGSQQNRFTAFFKRYGISILAGIVGLMIVGAGFKYFNSIGVGSSNLAQNTMAVETNRANSSSLSDNNDSEIPVVSSYNSDALADNSSESGNAIDNGTINRVSNHSLRNSNNVNRSDLSRKKSMVSLASIENDRQVNGLENQGNQNGYNNELQNNYSTIRLSSANNGIASTRNENGFGNITNRKNIGLKNSFSTTPFNGNNDYSKPELTNWIVVASYIGTSDVNGDFRDNTGISRNKNDFSMRGYYKLSDDFYLGVEFGKERFNQDFYTNNGKIHYQQSPELWYYGVTSMYAWHNAFTVPNVIYPYGSLFVGSNSAGMVTKLQSGISWGFLSYASMNFGAEYSYLLYPSDGNFFGNNLYYTQKFGFVAGLSVEF